MKKLLFVLAFIFIVTQAFSQIYIVTLSDNGIGSCTNQEILLTKYPPTGAATYICISESIEHGLVSLNQELNSIISQGYKLIETNNGLDGGSGNPNNGLINEESINKGTTFYFAIPWTSSGLEEVSVNSTTLKNLFISPNPATDFIDISLDYDLKGESQVVFISEAGYVSHKESIGEILKNEKYNIDISKIPAGKYLVTIVNGKTYTTPQKLIVF